MIIENKPVNKDGTPVTEKESNAAIKIRITAELKEKELATIKKDLNPMRLITYLHTHDLRESQGWRKATIQFRSNNEQLRDDLNAMRTSMVVMNTESFNFKDRRDKKKVLKEEQKNEEIQNHLKVIAKRKEEEQFVKEEFKSVLVQKNTCFEPHTSPRDVSGLENLNDFIFKFKTALQSQNITLIRQCIDRVEADSEADQLARKELEMADNHQSMSEALFEEYVDWGSMLIRQHEAKLAIQKNEKERVFVYDRAANAIIDRLFTKNVDGRMHIVNDQDNKSVKNKDIQQSNSSLETDSAFGSEQSEEPEQMTLKQINARMKVVPKAKKNIEEIDYRLQF